MKQFVSVYGPAILFVLVICSIALFPQLTESLQQLIGTGGPESYIIFIGLLTLAVVVMPVTVMPLIPVSAAVLGPLPTALLSIVGWTLGAVISFLISRHLGRPILERFVSMQKVDTFAAGFPARHRFFTIVLLRLTLPVDIASYALGLIKSVGFIEYTMATMLGVTWFSFAFAYLGDALLTGNMPLIIELGSVSLLIFIAGWYMLRRSKSVD
ncbi:MAG: putative membrane protein YdjX (TVP38/TMEM64 family) [Candidatus Azotimanducaceae bacterium]|jgi:uncharacterized membrane protein YdjX (TVP38/TMEM64 family)